MDRWIKGGKEGGRRHGRQAVRHERGARREGARRTEDGERTERENLPCFPYPCFHAFGGGVHARGGEGGREGGREEGRRKEEVAR